MTSKSIASILIYLLLTATLIVPEQLRAGILSPQEQALANLLMNDGGQKRSKSAMQVDPTLTAVARAKAKDMATRHYFDHITPDGKGPNYLVRAAGYPLPLWWGNSRTENNVESLSAGYASASAAWNALMASPGHRSHLLATDPFYKDQTSYGIGYYYDQSSPYWSYFVIITAPPRSKCTLAISNPANGALVGTEQITATGTVGGSDLVSNLDIRLENSDGISGWTHLSVPSGSGVGGWSHVVSGLRAGNNTIRLRSYATGGSLLAETARTVRWVILKPLNVSVEGGGKVSTGFAGTSMRELGVNYTINATPLDASTIFSHWSGLPSGSNINVSRQTFAMTEGLSLTAHFVPNPFWTRSGSYQGTLSGTQSFNTGQLKVSVSPTGTFSGRLFYGTGAYSIKGTLSASGTANIQIKRPGGSEIGLSIALDVAGNSDQISGSVNEYGMITALSAARRGEPTETMRRLTIRISPDAAVPTSPKGNGYAIACLDKTGGARITGTLADGRTFTANSIVSKTGGIPIYARLFGGAGALVGNSSLVNTTTNDIEGAVRWFKPERLKDKYYPNAFASFNAITGSNYVRPVKGTPFINFQTTDNRGRLLLSNGNIQTQIAQPLEVESDNSIALQTPTYTGMKITVDPNTGRFSGSFVHPERRD